MTTTSTAISSSTNVNTTTTPALDPSHLRTQLQKDGYVILRSLLSPTELSALHAAATSATALARAGSWPYIRTVGKQFPPWPSTPGPCGIWGVQHLLHPSLLLQLPEASASASASVRGAFAACYFGDAVTSVSRELLGPECGDADLVMELFNMLVRPETDFALRWHRDDIPASATAEEELARLGRPGERRAWHAQWNLALCDGDEGLVVVPGSHARARTVEEREGDPMGDCPGQVVVRLDAGDCVFYDNNIWHRGVYDSGRERMSLHGSVGHVQGGGSRARNVLQHGVGEWVERCDFTVLGEDTVVRKRAEGMRERLVKLGRESGDVGFSLEG